MIGPYSQGIKAKNLVCISGQLPINPATGEMIDDITAQTTQSLENLKAILDAAGCSLSDVVKTTVYLAKIDDFDAMNVVYKESFKAPYPARTAFQVVALPKQAKVEIEAFAYVDC